MPLTQIAISLMFSISFYLLNISVHYTYINTYEYKQSVQAADVTDMG